MIEYFICGMKTSLLGVLAKTPMMIAFVYCCDLLNKRYHFELIRASTGLWVGSKGNGPVAFLGVLYFFHTSC